MDINDLNVIHNRLNNIYLSDLIYFNTITHFLIYGKVKCSYFNCFMIIIIYSKNL